MVVGVECFTTLVHLTLSNGVGDKLFKRQIQGQLCINAVIKSPQKSLDKKTHVGHFRTLYWAIESAGAWTIFKSKVDMFWKPG